MSRPAGAAAPADTGATGLLDRLDGPDCLVYGIGNLGRQDDGLGWAFVDWVEAADRWPRTRLVRGYQLALEDAHLLSQVRCVLFVDATKDPAVDAFAVSRPTPSFDVTFTSHALSVPSVLATCRTCFGHVPQVWQVAIRGYAWGLDVGLTEAAAGNLAAALRHVSGDEARLAPTEPTPTRAAPQSAAGPRSRPDPPPTPASTAHWRPR